jgi:transcriptional regulator with XRE-family HTH domain
MIKSEKHKFEQRLALWLTSLREEKGLSQEALSVQLEKGQSDIAKIENGSKRVSVLELLSWVAALGIPYERVEEVLKPTYDEIVNKSNF